jgi:hypothetical protein
MALKVIKKKNLSISHTKLKFIQNISIYSHSRQTPASRERINKTPRAHTHVNLILILAITRKEEDGDDARSCMCVCALHGSVNRIFFVSLKICISNDTHHCIEERAIEKTVQKSQSNSPQTHRHFVPDRSRAVEINGRLFRIGN